MSVVIEALISYIKKDPLTLIFFFYIAVQLYKLKRGVKLLDIKHGATDHALEKHLQNGYTKNRDEYIEKKLSDDKFLNMKPKI